MAIDMVPETPVHFQVIENREIKTVGTLGPATDPVIGDVAPCLDVARLNRAHNSFEDIQSRAGAYLLAAERSGRQGEVLVDLQGLKFRTSKSTEPIEVGPGAPVRFMYEGFGSREGIIPVQDDFSGSVGEGQPASMGDGKLKMLIENVSNDGVVSCRVVSAPGERYTIVPNKGLNFPRSTFPDVLHPRDIADMRELAAGNIKPDYVGLSFTQSAAMIEQADAEAARLGLKVKWVPKIENEAGMKNAAEIVEAGDVTMFARGDSGPELVDPRRILEAQLTIAGLVRHHTNQGVDKHFMVCTNMMPSMAKGPIASMTEYTDAGLVVYLGGWPAVSDELSMNFEHAVNVARTLRDVVDFHVGRSALLQAAVTGGISPDVNRKSWW